MVKLKGDDMAVSLAFTFVGGNNQGISAGAKTITLDTEGGVDVVGDGFKKDLKIYSMGKSTSKQNEAPKVYVYDYKRGVTTYIVTGLLQDTSGGDDALTKKRYLKAMAEEGNPNKNTITFTWGDGLNSTVTVWISAIRFRQISGTPVYFYYEIELVEGELKNS